MSGDHELPDNAPDSRGAAALDAAFQSHQDLIAAAARVFVGFSGGPDSTVLLATAAEHCGDRLVALHANHGLQEAAARWELHCETVCAGLGVPLRSRSLEVQRSGQGLEAAARDARYAWFARELDRDGDLLLLAHHRDDQAETLLLRLLRGAGPDGLAAMPVTRSLGAGQLLRPFLDLPRHVILAEARRRHLTWLDDPSNDDERFDRNYLRHRIMPLLAERWPGGTASMARAAKLLREASALQRVEAPSPRFSSVGDPGLGLDQLSSDPSLAALELRAWLRAAGCDMPSAARLGECLRQCREGQGAELVLGDRILTRYRDALFLRPRLPETPGLALEPTLNESRDFPGVGSVTVLWDGSSGDALPGLELRLRRGGERLPTVAGSHRDLKTLCQERALPPWWRGRMPLLFERTTGGGALLAAGPLAYSPRCQELGLALRWTPPVLPVAVDGGPAACPS